MRLPCTQQPHSTHPGLLCFPSWCHRLQQTGPHVRIPPDPCGTIGHPEDSYITFPAVSTHALRSPQWSTNFPAVQRPSLALQLCLSGQPLHCQLYTRKASAPPSRCPYTTPGAWSHVRHHRKSTWSSWDTTWTRPAIRPLEKKVQLGHPWLPQACHTAQAPWVSVASHLLYHQFVPGGAAILQGTLEPYPFFCPVQYCPLWLDPHCWGRLQQHQRSPCGHFYFGSI